jgi:hypothetical protein
MLRILSFFSFLSGLPRRYAPRNDEKSISLVKNFFHEISLVALVGYLLSLVKNIKNMLRI